jgi:hypothetical protein
MEDINSKKVKIGDKIVGFGFLNCNSGFKIDLTPEVTVWQDKDILRFGQLSASSFRRFEIVERNGKRLKENEPITF